jgi:crotonobetaine/carnitine-CoA ligase
MTDTVPSLPVLVAERARTAPNRIAIESISTDEQISWQRLDETSRRWADAFRRLGVEAGQPVVTLMPNTPDATYAWLGCAWLRAIEVPVNPDFRGEWLTHAINNAQAPVVVTSARIAPSLARVAERLDRVETVVIYDATAEDGASNDELRALHRSFRVVEGPEFFAGAEPADDLSDPQVWDIMSAIYTSGTTGPAKAVLLPWGLLEDTHLLFSPPEFQNAVFYSFWPSFHTLGKSHLSAAAALDGKLVHREHVSVTDFWDDIRTYDCTVAFTVSVIANLLYGEPERDDDADNPLRAVIMGPVIPEVDDFKRRFGVKVYTTFGSTEVGSALYSFMRDVDSSNWQSCGRVVPESLTEVAVVDEHDIPVGPGSLGELIVRPKQPWVMNLGYLNMPEATVRAWRNGWYHTGDAFVFDENGEHYFVDRTTDYIRRRGENISSFEVEHAVGELPGVAQAAAVPVPADIGEDEVMVFVLPELGTALDPAELAESLVDRVPDFALPRYLEIVDELPTTQATFRVQKRKLRERGPGPSTFDRLQRTGHLHESEA